MMADGASRIIYTCPFVPAEWIAASGFKPSRIMPHAPGMTPIVGLTAGVCPFAHAFINEALSDRDAGGIVVTTVCDQMRRASELIRQNTDKPVFLMNVPHTWETVNAHKMYLSELERLGRFLQRLDGEYPAPSTLAEVMSDFDERRSALRDLRGYLTPRQFSESIARFHNEGCSEESLVQNAMGVSHIRSRSLQTAQISNAKGDTSAIEICAGIKPAATNARRGGIPLALVGGPLLADHLALFDLLEGVGGHIALDGSETGERTLPAPFDRRRLREEPLSVLAEAYFGTIPDAARRPNSTLYQWLRREIDERGIRGIVFLRYLWCDTWHGEAQRMKEWLGMPFFDLDITEDVSDLSRKLNRLQAFMEMLQ